MKLTLNRDVTVAECPWLHSDIPIGTVVYRFDGCTYGCISPLGVAVTFEPGDPPFLEVPRNALSLSTDTEER